MNKIRRFLVILIFGILAFPVILSGFNQEDHFYDLIFFKTQDKISYQNIEYENISSESDLKVLKIRHNSILASINNKLFKISNESSSVDSLNAHLPKPIENIKGLNRDITGITDSAAFILFKHTILKKSGEKYLPIKTNLSGSKRFVSIASDKNYLYIGTAVNGIFYSKIANDGRYYFSSMNKGLPFIPFNQKINFYEEIRELHVTTKGDLIAGTGINGGVYIKHRQSDHFKPLPWPENWQTSNVYLITDDNGIVWVSCSQGLVEYQMSESKTDMKYFNWSEFYSGYDQYVIQSRKSTKLYGYYINNTNSINEKKIERMKKASNKRLFYTSPYNLKTKKDTVESLLKSNNFNGVIIDVKDDNGFVLYESDVEFIKKSGAVKPVFNLNQFIEQVHNHGKYLAVRIVVFKDPVLFKNSDFAIWNSAEDKPWVGNPGERWVDPYNPMLAERYYIPLIQELTASGVDEIQLDYIRFPGEGRLGNCHFRYKKTDKYLSEAIEDFLLQIRNSTELPISIDIFGYQGLYRTGGFIGQDMEAFGKIVDVISPMLYSSHFGDKYLTDVEIDKRVFRLIEHSVRRAEFISSSEYLIRPYLQAFPMKNDIWGYGKKYFIDQVQASKEQSASGFSFWGSIDHMVAVDLALENEN